MQLETVMGEDNRTADCLSKSDPEGRGAELSMRVKYSTASRRDCICTATALQGTVHGFSLPLNPDLQYSQSSVLCLSSGEMATVSTTVETTHSRPAGTHKTFPVALEIPWMVCQDLR